MTRGIKADGSIARACLSVSDGPPRTGVRRQMTGQTTCIVIGSRLTSLEPHCGLPEALFRVDAGLLLQPRSSNGRIDPHLRTLRRLPVGAVILICSA